MRVKGPSIFVNFRWYRRSGQQIEYFDLFFVRVGPKIHRSTNTVNSLFERAPNKQHRERLWHFTCLKFTNELFDRGYLTLEAEIVKNKTQWRPLCASHLRDDKDERTLVAYRYLLVCAVPKSSEKDFWGFIGEAQVRQEPQYKLQFFELRCFFITGIRQIRKWHLRFWEVYWKHFTVYSVVEDPEPHRHIGYGDNQRLHHADSGGYVL